MSFSWGMDEGTVTCPYNEMQSSNEKGASSCCTPQYGASWCAPCSRKEPYPKGCIHPLWFHLCYIREKTDQWLQEAEGTGRGWLQGDISMGQIWGGDGNVLNLDCDGGYTILFIYQKLSELWPWLSGYLSFHRSCKCYRNQERNNEGE